MKGFCRIFEVLAAQTVSFFFPCKRACVWVEMRSNFDFCSRTINIRRKPFIFGDALEIGTANSLEEKISSEFWLLGEMYDVFQNFKISS